MRISPRGFGRPLAFMATVVLAGLVPPARAEDLTGYVEFSTTSLDGKTEIAGLAPLRTEATTFARRGNFNWTRRLFPTLQLQIGMFYEGIDGSIEEAGFERDTDHTTLRPNVRLSLRAPQFLGELSWTRSDEEASTGGLASLRLVRDSYLGIWGWYPSELPSVRLEAQRVEDRDEARTLVDRTLNSVRLISEYVPTENSRLYYRGAIDEDDDRVAGTESRSVSHNARASYSDRLFDGRWELGGSLNGTWRDTVVRSAGTGEVVLPVEPVGGLFGLDETPDDGVLDSLLGAPLVDGDDLVGSSANLGYTPDPLDDDRRNLGVDFGIERDVNRLLVWVDRLLPFGIASSFSWEIWTSADGQTWVSRAVLPTAPFGPFDNRFELRFPSVMTRYLKIVVRPLAPTVPDATLYPSILVTELEPLLAVVADSFEETISTTRNLAQAFSRFRIAERPGLYYETTYSHVADGTTRTSWTLSNGLSLHHRFNQVWSTSARVAREDGVERLQDRVAYVYSAALVAEPYPTLRHGLVFSGEHDETGGINTDNDSVFLNTNATPAEGVDLNLVLGKSVSRTTGGPRNDAIQFGGGVTLTPYRSVTMNIRYDDRDVNITQPPFPDRQDRTRSAEAGVAYNPLPSLYFFASRRKEQRTERLDRTTDSFAWSWAPFPGGALQVSLTYNETRYSDLDEVDRLVVPYLRWNVNPRSYFEIAYQMISTEQGFSLREDNILTATLRLGF